ncbi:probable CCR4-associated factor 1 homolog 11 [Miscanthus floridulus]|uniref:probable CCR4-associated factor 1 homolog 11 n=1 Tax=Miscanthus floridulus TaxID=154761 RepID=UPI00345764D2
MPSVEVGGAGGWRPKHLHQQYQPKHLHQQYQPQQPPPHPHPPPQPLEIREVWADNVEREFKLIRAAIERFPYVSMDTEFPGVIHHPPPSVHHSALTPSQRYTLLKSNVDALHLIQVGLAFAASPSSPPALAFQINLREFDPRVHRHAPDSVRLLAASGVDLAAHRARGLSARAFAALLMSSGLVCNPDVAWVTFCSAYDFAYLVKVLMGRKLPRALPEFLRYVRVYFGAAVYDVKHMARVACDSYGEVALLGGLERVAGALRVRRAAGRGHQAASDSVLTWDTFREMARLYFPKEGSLDVCAGVLYGLELRDGGDATTKPAKCALRC